jgi:predicted small metal-binding protein
MKCGDLMPGCDFEARGDTEEDIMNAAATHAKEVHGLNVTPELADKVKSEIKDE